MEVFEGYMLKYGDAVWSVKGCDHPEGYAVALPRVFKGRKIKRLGESMKIVMENFQSIVTYYDNVGFQVPLVPLSESTIIDPFQVTPKDPLSREFSSFFPRVGITGSMAYSDSWRDVDFLSVDSSDYNILRRLRSGGVTSPLSTVNESEIETLDRESFKVLKQERVTEGKFRDMEYTFKIVECVSFPPVQERREVEGDLTVLDEIKPFSLPVMYRGEMIIKGDATIPVYLTSYRTRFTELKRGTKLRIKGVLLFRKGNFLDLDLDIAETVSLS
jgi:hypothetical protein